MEKVVEIIWQDISEEKQHEQLIEKVMQKCFEVENISPTSLYVCVTLTNPENIRQINKQYRNIDKPTDVLSFPMFEKEELDKIRNRDGALQHIIHNNTNPINMPTIQDTLGDIIISIPQVELQAKEYEHGFERELAYMLVHGFYHLMGYDHMIEEEKNIMRKKEENVLEQLEIIR